MTSTVLDVTVLLLCVSASVVTLVGGGTSPVADAVHQGESASTVADRLVTQTATLRYDALPRSTPDAEHERATAAGDANRRTIHATLAELLATATWTPAAGSIAGDDGDEFRSNAFGIVDEAIGPRASVDVRSESASAEPAESLATVGADPPRDATVSTAVVTLPPPATAPEDVETVRFVVRRW